MRPRRSMSDGDAQRPPAKSKVLRGNQQRCAKQSKTFISVRI
ncbi:hypothetical protein ABEX35_20725 [Priestia megaterium]